MLVKRDLRRIIVSIDIWMGALLVLLSALFLSFLISSGIKFGISVFGNLTIFSNGKLILINGANYTKGIGLILAVLVSLFVGKEYRYKTFGYVISKNINRRKMYFAKVLSSIIIGIFIFLTYEIIAYSILSFSGKSEMSLAEFSVLLLNGILLYSSISSVICLISMSIKNYVMSLILSIAFIFLESNFVLALGKIFKLIKLDFLFEKIVRYSLYGMNEIISSSPSFSLDLIGGALLIILISTLIGFSVFKYKEI